MITSNISKKNNFDEIIECICMCDCHRPKPPKPSPPKPCPCKKHKKKKRCCKTQCCVKYPVQPQFECKWRCFRGGYVLEQVDQGYHGGYHQNGPSGCGCGWKH